MTTLELTTSITVDDPIAVISDKDAQLLQILRNRYRGKNFGGVHIKEVNNITEMSDFVCNAVQGGGSAVVNVKFLVECTYYAAGDIIADTYIFINQKQPWARSTTNIMCKLFAFSKQESDLLSTVGSHKDGKLFLPVVVSRAEHPPMKDNIGIFGKILVPTRHELYKISAGSSVSADLLTIYADERKKIETELDIRAKLTDDKKRVLLLFERIYSGKSTREGLDIDKLADIDGYLGLKFKSKPKTLTTLLDTKLRLMVGKVYYMPNVYSCPMIAEYEKEPDPEITLEVSADEALKHFLLTCRRYLSAMNEMSTIYTEKMITTDLISFFKTISTIES